MKILEVSKIIHTDGWHVRETSRGYHIENDNKPLRMFMAWTGDRKYAEAMVSLINAAKEIADLIDRYERFNDGKASLNSLVECVSMLNKKLACADIEPEEKT